MAGARRAGRVRAMSSGARRPGRAALTLVLLAASLTVLAAVGAPPAGAEINGLGAKPYLGWSSWSLQSTNYPGVNPDGPASWLNEAHILEQADVLARDFASHGYEYVNVDAGWQGGVDPYGRPTANPATFPHGMRYLGDRLHAKGLKFGIYLAVGLDPRAYGDGATPIHATSGCHTRDIVYPDLRTTNGWNSAYQIDYSSPCAQAYADSIADLFAGWGVDFLKMDGVGPGSFQGGANHDNTADVAAWARALDRTGRKIQYVVSWALSHRQADTWKRYTNGWRIDTDVECYCDTLVRWDASVKQRWNDVVQWIADAGPGHWNNLDSLDVGSGVMDGLTEAERQSYATLWAIEAAPLYLGDDLTRLDGYGRALLTNDEVIAVNQAGNPARPVSQAANQQVWYARNADGSYTVALFNLGDAPATVTANWDELGIAGPAQVRDLWQHANLGNATGGFGATLPVHGSRLLRITPSHGPDAGPTMPMNPHATASTPSSVSLGWDPAAERGARITGYDVYANATKVASVSGTTATVAGLTAATGYRFTVVATDSRGRASLPGKAVEVTTPDAGGPVPYEAEDAANTVAGGATRSGCSGCSGGGKVGNLGGTGALTFPAVIAPRAGTYLMTVGYVDGGSSRTAVLTVNGAAVNLPLSGTNDNNWDSAQSTTVAVPLRAGANTIAFGNPTDYVSDIDKIAL